MNLFTQVSTSLKRLTLGTEGDISFYEDTGTTPKFFWDSSAESLGIGTSSPSGALDIGGQHVLNDNYDALGASFTRNGAYGSVLSLGRQGVSSGVTLDYPADNTFALSTNGAEAVRIDDDGNVGIGTSSPSAPLDVLSSSDQVICNFAHPSTSTDSVNGGALVRIQNTNATNGNQSSLIFADSASSASSGIFGFNTNHTTHEGYMVFGTRDSAGSFAERMRIDSDGNVLVGKTSESGNTAGHFISESGYQRSTRNGSVQVLNRITTDGPITDFQKDGTSVGSISVTGSTTSYNTSSDYRLKTDAQPMTGATERVQELNPVNFEWIANGSRVDGFLAHEAQEVVPEAVSGERDAMRDEEYEVTPEVLDDDGNVTTEAVMGTRSVPDYQGIDQSKLVPLLTAALQEALTEISSLKSRVEALEG